MEPDLDTLLSWLQNEEAHLAWFEKSGQRMNASGTDTTEEYLVDVRARIDNLKRQIAARSEGGA
jgi:hypothetical protein